MTSFVIFATVTLLAAFATQSTYSLKCYELVDSKCTLVSCSGSCYYGNATVNQKLVNMEAKCSNIVQKDSCLPEWRDFDTKYDCYCNKDKCNDVYCHASKADHEEPSSKSSHTVITTSESSPSDYSISTTHGNDTTSTTTSSNSSSSVVTSSEYTSSTIASTSSSIVSTSSSSTSTSTSTESSITEDTDDYEPSPRTTTTTDHPSTRKSGAPVVASVFSLTVISVMSVLLV